MHPFEFNLSLRAFHPSVDLGSLFDDLGKISGLVQGQIWKADDDYYTQAGDRLIGKRKESYFFLRVEKNSASLLDVMEELLGNLQSVKKNLQEHVKNGGRLEFYLSLYGSTSVGITFPGECLKALADFPIELALEIYSEDSKGSDE